MFDFIARIGKLFFYLLCCFALTFLVIYFYGIKPPEKSMGTVFSVQKGESLRGIAENLASSGVIQSPLLFLAGLKIVKLDTGILPGEYTFPKNASLFEVITLFKQKKDSFKSISMTIPEGSSSTDIAKILTKGLPNLSYSYLEKELKTDEGYFFPDTYTFTRDTNEDTILSALRENFKKKTASIQKDIASSPYTLHEALTYASILEKEARGDEDRAIISGILKNRLQKNMPLQVDATFLYILGKGSKDLSLQDLKVDSLYNTYIHTGLPPGPINNPGLKSISAVLNPERSDYLYYLHGKDGVARFGKTFEDHKKNKKLYLY